MLTILPVSVELLFVCLLFIVMTLKRSPAFYIKRSDSSLKIDAKLEEEVVPEPEAPIQYGPSRLHRVRGCRGGFYSKNVHQYNGVLGIDDQKYHELLSKCELAFFGQALHEGLKARFAVRAQLLISESNVVLPANQQIKLLGQLWLDMTTSKLTEDYLIDELENRSKEYRAKFERKRGIRKSLLDKMRDWMRATASIVSGGWVSDKESLPRLA